MPASWFWPNSFWDPLKIFRWPLSISEDLLRLRLFPRSQSSGVLFCAAEEHCCDKNESGSARTMQKHGLYNAFSQPIVSYLICIFWTNGNHNKILYLGQKKLKNIIRYLSEEWTSQKAKEVTGPSLKSKFKLWAWALWWLRHTNDKGMTVRRRVGEKPKQKSTKGGKTEKTRK